MLFTEGLEEIYLAYRDDVYRLAVSYTRSFSDAEDVCQSVFLKLMQQQHVTPGKEKAWLMQVTANECRSLLRSGWYQKPPYDMGSWLTGGGRFKWEYYPWMEAAREIMDIPMP